MVIKHLLLLANSRKFNERCVAGREMVADRIGAWIRPVSSSELGEVDRFARQYAPGRGARGDGRGRSEAQRAYAACAIARELAARPPPPLASCRPRSVGRPECCADTAGPLWFDGHSTRLSKYFFPRRCLLLGARAWEFVGSSCKRVSSRPDGATFSIPDRPVAQN